MAPSLVVTARTVLGLGEEDRLPEPDPPAGEQVELEEGPEDLPPEGADAAPEPAPPAEAATRELLDQLSDDRINQMSEAVSAVAGGVATDQAEQLIDAWADYVEAAMGLKARLNAVSLAAIPSRQVQEKMEEALRPLLEEVRPFEPVT